MTNTIKTESMEIVVNLETLSFTVKDLNTEEVSKVKTDTKSGMFRKLYALGISVADISRVCKSHYSFVYGVIQARNELKLDTTPSKSDIIRDLYANGLKVNEISKQLQANYSFVHTVVKKYIEEGGQVLIKETAVVQEPKKAEKLKTIRKHVISQVGQKEFDQEGLDIKIVFEGDVVWRCESLEEAIEWMTPETENSPE